MKVSIFGAGYVGLSFAACLAEAGHEVLCADADAARIEGLQQGRMPLHEPGLEALVAAGLAASTLRFTANERAASLYGEVLFIVVNTPADAEGDVDLRHVMAVARSIGQHRDRDGLVVCKSTAPVGTAEQVESVLQNELSQRGKALRVAVAVNPEFLREGSAVRDCRQPHRVVLGAADPGSIDLLTRLYQPFVRDPKQLLVMDRRSAELTKYAANAMLATRISFMNELANLAEKLGVDIEQVRRGMGSDPRIGHGFLHAGLGYGGSCLPKDVQALVHTAAIHGQRLQVLEAVRAANDAQRLVLIEKIVRRFGEDLRGRRFGVWGLAFKPGTDDMREAPSRIVVKALLMRGAEVVAHDPVANAEARKVLASDLDGMPDLLRRLSYADSAMQAADEADALVILTDWKAFKSPNFSVLKAVLKQPLIFDGRNLYDPEIRSQGFDYQAIGR
jgi:UDPglucose 6-dehydrogenase